MEKDMYYGLKEGDEVIKDKGDYTFEGKVVSVFYKINGAIRVVVENEAGILHIFNPLQLKSKNKEYEKQKELFKKYPINDLL